MNLKGIMSGMILVGIGIIAVSIVLIKNGIAVAIWSGVGLGLIIIAGIGLIFSSLYVKARGNLAYFKTGKGGPQVIKDHGRIVIGFLHEIIPVSLETMKITVERKGKDSLITLDFLRAEVVAEFYIRVRADELGIETAARTLGDKISAAAGRRKAVEMDQEELLQAQIQAVARLEREKLIDALRTVAATKNLNDLNVKRSEFKKAVMEVVKDGLEQNGLELEDCTISALDQASKDFLDPNNQFDAKGLMNLQQTISEAAVMENEYKRSAELAIKKKDVDTATSILEQDQALKFKAADQGREVRTYEAEQNKSASMAELQNEEEVGRRAISKEKGIRLEAVAKEQEVATKEVEREQAIETAGVNKMKQVEIAQKDKEIAVAKRDAERAQAEKVRNEAVAQAEKARQDVETVIVGETAQRQKQKAIIDKQAEIEKERQEEQMKADVKAYAVTKEAEGRKQAAEADYLAKTRAAEADLVEKTKHAEGLRAEQMVPVEVAARQVEVDKSRIETVLKPELEAKAAHDKVSIDLTLGQLRIEADKEVGIAMAHALGDMCARADMTIFGDPETLARMSEKFQYGLGLASTAEGLLKGASEFKGVLAKFAPLAKKAGIDLSSLVETQGETPAEEGPAEAE